MQLPDLSLLLAMALFWATFFVLRAFLLRPLGAILEEREKNAAAAADTLDKALGNEREALSELDRRLTQARREALDLRQAARAEANAKRQAVLEKTRADTHRVAEQAQAGLEKNIAAAREELAASASVTAREIAALALGRKIA